MAFISSRMCFMAFCLSLLRITLFSPATADQVVSFWSAWGECSNNCDGEQTRTRQCVSENCDEAVKETRECSHTSWSTGCFSEAMAITLAVIGAAILLAVIIIIILCRRNRKEKERQNNKSREMSEMIEQRYDDSINTNQTRRHFPSAESFPEPQREPMEMDLENFAFDQESLNESIHEMAFTFGTDEEFQPKAQNKKEEKKVSLKVVSVTETQAIDRDNGLEVRKDPSPTYAVVMKPKVKANGNVTETQAIDRDNGPPPTYAAVMKPKVKANGNVTETQVNDGDDSDPIIKTRKYSVVMKPEAKDNEDVVDVAL